MASDQLVEEDNQFRISKKPNSLQESLRIYARYTPYPDPSESYRILEEKSVEQRIFPLQNGHEAHWFRKNSCQYVVWVHQQIERIVEACSLSADQQALFEQIASSIDAPQDQLSLGPITQPNLTIQGFQSAMLENPVQLPNADWHTEYGLLFPDDWTIRHDASDFCNFQCVPVVATPLEVESDFARNEQHEPELWVSLNYMRTEHSDPYQAVFKANTFSQVIQLKDQQIAVLFIEELEDRYMLKLVWIEGEYTQNLYARIPKDARADQYLPSVQTIFQSALQR